LAGSLVAAFATVALVAPPAVGVAHADPGSAGASTNSKIKHVVEIMLENHSYDNLFGQFPGADGIPAGQTFLSPNAEWAPAPALNPIVVPQNAGATISADNSTFAEKMAMDYTPGAGYLMDHYSVLPQDGLSSITTFPASVDPNLQALAKQFTLSDSTFQAGIEPSNPNLHWSLTGTDNGWVYNSLQPGTTGNSWNSIFKQLDASGRTSKIYYGQPQGSLSQFWYQMLPADRPQDASTDTQFYTDLTNNQLPNFSYVRPDYNQYTEGDGAQDVTQGDAWLGQVMQAIAKSPEWASTAVFITYDESGGYWDHVSPPVTKATAYGPRLPFVIVSPYTKNGVYSKDSTNVSVLSFMQKLWGLPALTPMNAAQNNLMDAFDFHQKPHAAPTLPQVPNETIAITRSTNVPSPGKPVTLNFQANTPALTLDPTCNGQVDLTVTPPAGVTAPAIPSTITLVNGVTSLTTTFAKPGYYRIAATGPNGSQGWTTVTVGITANSPF
jgi:phospholipase C